MSEAEIMEQMFSIWDRYWVLAQWWTSVSFGLILVAFFAADKLRIYLLLIVLALYTGYSTWVYMLFLFNLDIAYGLAGDLASMEAAGELRTKGAKILLSSPYFSYGMLVSKITLPATFLACIGYLLYAYFQNLQPKGT